MTAPPTNSAANSVNTVISETVKVSEAVVTNAIVADISVLTGPMAPVSAFLINTFVKPFISPLVSYIGGKFSKALQTAGTFTVIDIQVGIETSNVSKELAAVIAAEKSGDANAIKIAIQNYANANSALIHSDGSAAPQ